VRPLRGLQDLARNGDAKLAFNPPAFFHTVYSNWPRLEPTTTLRTGQELAPDV
jgi:hypothetical protein